MRVKTSMIPTEMKDTREVNHPFQQQRELKRAINYKKIQNIYARPFLDALDPPHIDTVLSLSIIKKSYDGNSVGSSLVSSSADGGKYLSQ